MRDVDAGRVRRWGPVSLTRAAANRVVTELAPLAESMVADCDEIWNGVALLRVLGVGAHRDAARIAALLGVGYDRTNPAFPSGPAESIAAWKINGVYVFQPPPGSRHADIHLTADTSDEQLATLAAQAIGGLEQLSRRSGASAAGVGEYLRDQRDRMRAAAQDSAAAPLAQPAPPASTAVSDASHGEDQRSGTPRQAAGSGDVTRPGDTAARVAARVTAEDIAARVPDGEVVEGEWALEVWVNWMGGSVPRARITVPDQPEIIARAPRACGATFELVVPDIPVAVLAEEVTAMLGSLFGPGAVGGGDATFRVQQSGFMVELTVPVVLAVEVAAALVPLIHPDRSGRSGLA
ncbi:hypothetical protein ACWDUL_21030 [Nocardia niigatensis]